MNQNDSRRNLICRQEEVFSARRIFGKELICKAEEEKGEKMPSKSEAARETQREYWQNKLNQRLSFLTDKDMGSSKIIKDATVRKIRAKLRETEGRLKAIADLEKKKEDMARRKAEKKAAPKKEKAGKKKGSEQTQEMSKRQQKKKKKTESKGKD
jgi:hypothetical protein